MINNFIIYKFFKDLTNHRKNRVVVFSCSPRVQISDLRISDLQIEFVFLQITLSSFCEIRKLKLSFFWNFCLQGNQKVSVYTSSLTNHLNVKLYTIFLHLQSILAPNPQWGAYSSSPYPLTVGTSP